MKKRFMKMTTLLFSISLLINFTTYTAKAFESLKNFTNEPLVFTLNAKDGDSGVRVMETPDGVQLYFGVYTQGVKQSQIDYEVHGNGVYTFTAIDVASNTASTSQKIENIDRLAPTLTTKGNVSSWVNKDVVISVEMEDKDSGIRRITLPNGTVEYFEKGNKDPIKREFVVKLNGTYTFEVEDVAGNIAKVTEFVTFIDKIAPAENIITINK